MGLISKDQAYAIIAQVRQNMAGINEGGVRYIDVLLVEKIINDYVDRDSEPSQIDHITTELQHLRYNIDILESNHAQLRTGSDNDFSIVHGRIDKIHKAQDQLDNWLHALEKAIMELKGMLLGVAAVGGQLRKDGHNGYLTKDKPQREEI